MTRPTFLQSLIAGFKRLTPIEALFAALAVALWLFCLAVLGWGIVLAVLAAVMGGAG